MTIQNKIKINQCNIGLLHDTPLSSSQALFKAFSLVNKEWPLTNSGALIQRLKLIGSSQDLLNSDSHYYNNNDDKIESFFSSNTSIQNLNGSNSISISNKTKFHFVYNSIQEKQLPYLLPFSVVAYLEVNNENNEINNNNKENSENNKIIKNNIDIKIIGHSRWALAKSIFSKNSNSRQVVMDSLVVDKDYRNYGIGKAILLYGEEILKRMNVNQIYLQTKHAKNFYLKYGYEESKVVPIIKIDKKIYENIPLKTEDVEKVIQNELSSDETSKPRPFNFSNAVWMEKKLLV
ncbi:hypothetical protein PIROE2DRAFT_14277 [Piromyces sp. E2]|nr:hypothetical protein PIROE2DRAFT_14277 [Piromyces sp. E2]|eukprot:OUM60054.1 hypothetical protein PIROE2DRAFT_14277 [Piromyces sp. E2]